MTGSWDIVTIAGTLGCGAVGGVFFAFSSFVMAGLGRLPDADGIEAMKSINVTAVRPVFMLALFGSAAVCVALVVRAVTTWGDGPATFLLAGSLLYLVGGVGVTMVYNVPRNERLATLSSTAPDAATRWRSYRTGWTIANHVRTVMSLAAMVMLVLARVSHGR